MIKGKTESGFEFEIDEAVGDDAELLDELAEADDNPLLMPGIIKGVLGAEQKKALYDHLRGDNGKVSTTKVLAEFIEIMNSAGEKAKNS